MRKMKAVVKILQKPTPKPIRLVRVKRFWIEASRGDVTQRVPVEIESEKTLRDGDAFVLDFDATDLIDGFEEFPS